jgi:antitoxin (DNA-binding transcriptional repressor) of toxin-antitoxin stability system
MQRAMSRTKTVGIRVLKAHLSRYLREVAEGAALEITDRGHPVARLLLMPEEPREA